MWMWIRSSTCENKSWHMKTWNSQHVKTLFHRRCDVCVTVSKLSLQAWLLGDVVHLHSSFDVCTHSLLCEQAYLWSVCFTTQAVCHGRRIWACQGCSCQRDMRLQVPAETPPAYIQTCPVCVCPVLFFYICGVPDVLQRHFWMSCQSSPTTCCRNALWQFEAVAQLLCELRL